MRAPALTLAILLGLGAAACSRADADVQADVQQALGADPATASLTVTVKEGVATLGGITSTKAQQDRATDIARAVKGVKTIESQMQIDNAALLDAVKAAVAADESLRDIPLNIEAREGEVTLSSDKTNADQRAKLAQVVRSVYGVNHVEDNMK